jgi:hypothetical protein
MRLIGSSPRNVVLFIDDFAAKPPGRAGDASSLDPGDFRHSRRDHPDPAMTVHLSRTDTARRSTQRTAGAMGYREMTDEKFGRRA